MVWTNGFLSRQAFSPSFHLTGRTELVWQLLYEVGKQGSLIKLIRRPELQWTWYWLVSLCHLKYFISNIQYTSKETDSASKIVFDKRHHSQTFYLSNFLSRSQLIYFSVVPSGLSGESFPSNFHSPQGETQAFERHWTINNHEFFFPGWTNTLSETIPSDLFVCQASFLGPRPEFGKLFSIQAVFDPTKGSYACKVRRCVITF